MSKKMTPCEKLGYKVGDKFKVVDGTGIHYAVGSFITLIHDDGSSCPRFNGVHSIYESGDSFFPLDFVEKVAKLKPAKQALADAIHQNGGWQGGKYAVYGKQSGRCAFLTCRPQYLTKDHGWFVMLSWIAGEFEMKPFINWHQCILSRDEYFTAYPEQVKVENKNETEQIVEVEMTSESEATINASDWHKSGELPPVGEVCLYVVSERLSAEVEITAHAKFGLCFVEIGKSGERYVSKTAELHRFRPIRSERDKAIDEMVCEFIDHHGNPKVGERYLGIAAKLYDAGYRKEVK